MKMRRQKVNKSLYIVMICLLAVVCAIPAVSAFFTDHAVLSAQIKTGTWNYSLAIDPKGGTWNGTASATLMENLEAGQTVAIADPVRTGYTFTNWTLSAGSAGTFDSAKKIYTAAPGSKDTLSANWRANTYKIAFDGNGADGGSMPAQSLTYDAKSALSANAFTRTGYSFSGWNTSADGKGTAYADGASVNNLSADDGAVVTLYAQWSAITYHITYDLNGGTGASDNPTEYTVETGAITLTAPTRTGYTFTGWTGANGDTPQTDVTIPSGSTGDKTYTANWEPITYTISYDLDGGSIVNPPTSYTVESANITLPTPTRTGYTFNGWTGSNGTELHVTTLIIMKGSIGDKSYKANWTANKYTVTLSKGQGIDSVSGDGTYAYGETVTIDATVNSNYNWSQWNVISGTVPVTLTNQKLTFTMPAEDVSLRAGDAVGSDAHRKTYVITYHANLHDGQKLQDSDGTGSTDTHIASIPSGAVKGTSGGTEVYQQTILSGGGSKVLENGFSWTVVKAAAAKVVSTLFDTNWDE